MEDQAEDSWGRAARSFSKRGCHLGSEVGESAAMGRVRERSLKPGWQDWAQHIQMALPVRVIEVPGSSFLGGVIWAWRRTSRS